MKVLIDNQTYDVSEETIKQFIPAYKPGKWQPDFDYEYWKITQDGNVATSYWDNSVADKFCLLRGEVFRTEAEAERHLAYLKAIAEIRDSSDFVPDWDDAVQIKYFVLYGHTDDELSVNFCWQVQETAPVYYPTDEACRQAIRDHKQAYLTYFGVSEEASERR